MRSVTVPLHQQMVLSFQHAVRFRGKKMALSGLEWVIIGVVAIVIIMWGPAKIPELAKALGKAKGEFDKASKDFQEAATTTANGPKIRSNDEILLETAQNLGIATDGKTREQISAEISEKVKTIGAAA